MAVLRWVVDMRYDTRIYTCMAVVQQSPVHSARIQMITNTTVLFLHLGGWLHVQLSTVLLHSNSFIFGLSISNYSNTSVLNWEESVWTKHGFYWCFK